MFSSVVNEIITRLKDWLELVARSMGQSLGRVAEILAGFVGERIIEVGNIVRQAIERVGFALDNIVRNIFDVIDRLGSGFAAILNDVINTLARSVEAITSFLSELQIVLADVLDKLRDEISKGIAGISSAIADAFRFDVDEFINSYKKVYEELSRVR